MSRFQIFQFLVIFFCLMGSLNAAKSLNPRQYSTENKPVFHGVWEYFQNESKIFVVPSLLATAIFFFFRKFLIDSILIKFIMFIPGWIFLTYLLLDQLQVLSVPINQLISLAAGIGLAWILKEKYNYSFGLFGGFAMAFGIDGFVNEEFENLVTVIVFDAAAAVFMGTVVSLAYQTLKRQQRILFIQFGAVYTVSYVFAMHTCGYTSLFPNMAQKIATSQFNGILEALIILSGFSIIAIIGSAVFLNVLVFCGCSQIPFFIKYTAIENEDPHTN